MPLSSAPDAGDIRFQKVRDAGGVLNATVALVRRNAREVLPGFLAIVGPTALASGLASALYLRTMGDFLTMDPEDLATADPLAMFGAGYVGTVLFGLLTWIVALAVTGAYVRLYREGAAGGISVGELWEETKGLLLPMAGLTLATIAVVFASVFVMIIPCLGLLAVLAFYVWTVPYVAVIYAARVVEEPTLAGAYRRARLLVKGMWPFAAGAMVIAWIVAAVVGFALSIPAYVAAAVIGANAAGDPAELIGTLSVVAAPLQILTVTVYLVPLLAAFFVHGRLVEDLEGTSLVDSLDALADDSAGARWHDAPRDDVRSDGVRPGDDLRSTPPALPPSPPPASRLDEPDEPAEGPPDEPGDDAPRGFRGGGFGGA